MRADKAGHPQISQDQAASSGNATANMESSNATASATESGRDKSDKDASDAPWLIGEDMKRKSFGALKYLLGGPNERVHIDTCRASNLQTKDLRGLVVVFVGGTGGIGASTARELFRRTTAPKAYIVGRNKKKAEELVNDLHELNPEGQAIFLEKDCALIKNVDEVSAEIKLRESKINCLFLTSGYMTTQGRNETAEGLDRKMTVNYYSRVRWTLNLMPLLTAASQAGELSRVSSVLAAGSEGDVDIDDLDLRHHFTLHACLAHCVVMTDFMVEELAKHYPGTSFSHSYPGTVKTGIASELTGPARLAVKVLYAVMTPWILNIYESGERHFFQMTSKCYPPAHGGAGIDLPDGLSAMRGSNGKDGSGAYLLDWDGKPTGDERYLEKYRSMGLGKIVWEHTLSMFEQVEQSYSQPGDKRSASDTPEGGDRNPRDPPGWRPA